MLIRPTATSRAALSRRLIPAAPTDFEGARGANTSLRYLEPLLPEVGVVERFHRALAAYVREPDARFLIRAVSGLERGTPVTTREGVTLLPTDNAPAWWWHAIMFNDVPVAPDGLAGAIDSTPARMFDIPRVATVNGAGWYVAHLLGAKDGDVDWRSWSLTTATWRFVRNIHPCNVFYVPKWTPEWKQVGEDPDMIASVAAHYRTRYAAVWDEFALLAAAPVGHGRRAADGRVTVHAAPTTWAAGAAQRRVSRPREVQATSDALPAVWAEILRPGGIPRVGALLARHPESSARTRLLLDGLTVQRLIAIADALHNRCRVGDMQAMAPGDPVRQSTLAWDALDRGATKTYRITSGWTGAADLLADGQEMGLAAVMELDIEAIARVGARIVAGPYDRSVPRRSA